MSALRSASFSIIAEKRYWCLLMETLLIKFVQLKFVTVNSVSLQFRAATKGYFYY